MEQIRKVFLSSTSRELAEQRRKVIDALQRLDGWDVIHMERFGARAWAADDFCPANNRQLEGLQAGCDPSEFNAHRLLLRRPLFLWSTMGVAVRPKAISKDHYHVFLASPGDMKPERNHVREFFRQFNVTTAHEWDIQFDVVDWENYATAGVGRPQELITQATLERYRGSLALVVGLMGGRFGTPSGEAESGTEEEFRLGSRTLAE